MPAKKAATKKRKTAKTARKKAASRKASAKKKVTRKKASTRKRAPTRAKASKKKVTARKPSKKKAAKKKAAKKTAARKKSSKKKATKKTSRKKVAKKKAPARKTTRKTAKKKATSRKAGKKKVAKKKTGRKKAAAKKPASRKKAVTKKKSTSRKRAPARRRTTARKPAKTASALSGPIHGVQPYKPKRGEQYMSDGQLEHFREILTAWKRELMFEVDRTVHHMQDEAANFPDPNDRATQESEFGLELRTRDRERKLLRKIDQALIRIDEGSYGYCEDTGEEIGLKRLEARPVATLCLVVQERRQLAERQYRDRDDRYR